MMMRTMRRLLARLSRRAAEAQKVRERTRREDFLKALYHYALVCPSEELLERIRLQARLSKESLPSVIGELALEGLIELNPLRLTPRGKDKAMRLVRAHRIYEKYLAEHSGYAPEEWHSKAEEMEHKLSPEEQERIAQLLRNPLWDPHGDPIPTEENALPLPPPSVAKAEAGQWYLVQHVEDDEPEAFACLSGLGLAQGSVVNIKSAEGEALTLLFEGEVCRLPLSALKSLNLVLLDSHDPLVALAQRTRRLTSLKEGEESTILAISPSCVGAMRRRLMDLGFVKGSSISIDLQSPLGNPTAYVVRHTAIALRADQARHILIER